MGVKRTGDGRWQARWRDSTGRQRARTFARKVDAQRHHDLELAKRHRGEGAHPEAPKITVAAMADLWLTGARNLGDGGRGIYRRDLDRHILPALGDLPLRQLTPDRIDTYLTTAGRTLAPSTVHRHYRTLRRLCAVAVDRQYLPANPCTTITPPSLQGAPEMRFLTVAEIDRLAAAIAPRYRAWVLLAAWGGPRWSETMGLRRRHLDLDRHRVSIVEQRVWRDGAYVTAPPKTRAGRRTITLPAHVTAALGDHLDTYVPAELDALVFTTSSGRTPEPGSFRWGAWSSACARAGLATRPKGSRKVEGAPRIHDLRHTAVALAIAAGAHPKEIQARMGHGTIGVTLDRYGHLMPGADVDLAARLDGLYRPPGD